MKVIYLGISGVLHPSSSTYELVYGRSPWVDGHAQYEAVPWLADLRRDALARVGNGLPGPKVEEWRFTPLTDLAKLGFIPAATAEGRSQAEALRSVCVALPLTPIRQTRPCARASIAA